MPDSLNTEEFIKLWDELMMKFPHNIKQVSIHPQSEMVMIQMRRIPRHIKDAMIVRRFKEQRGITVGFAKILTPCPPPLTKKTPATYNVWLKVHTIIYQWFYMGPDAYPQHRYLSPQEFEKCLRNIQITEERLSF